jgi:hypothetical protein
LTLIAILALTVSLAVVWRLTRFAVKLLMLGALITLIASYGTSAHRAAGARARSAPPAAHQRPPGAPVVPRSKGRSRSPVERRREGAQ